MKKQSLIVLGILVALFICNQNFNELKTDISNKLVFEKNEVYENNSKPVRRNFHLRKKRPFREV